MKLLQNNALGDNKLNCFKATQVLGGPTQILIWGFEIAKSPTRQIKEGPGAFVSRGTYEPQWCHGLYFFRFGSAIAPSLIKTFF